MLVSALGIQSSKGQLQPPQSDVQISWSRGQGISYSNSA